MTAHSELTRQKSELQHKTRTLCSEIQKQTSPNCLVLINSRKHECKCCQPKQKTWGKLQSILTSWLTRASFSAESTNNIKTKITHHRVMEDGCIWEGLLLLNAF